MPMRTEDQILNFLKYNGPSLPMKIAKHLGEDSLITSAYLSEMVTQRKIKISHLKIGTSPLYYLPGQETQLVNFTSEFKAKDQEVLEKLKNYGVLREGDQELLAKVALRKMKDFALPLQVNFQGQKELFWKWYLLSDEESNAKISELLGIIQNDTSPETDEQVNKEEIRKEVEETIEPVLETEPITLEQEQSFEPDQKIEDSIVEEKYEVEHESYPPDTTEKDVQKETGETYPPDTSKKELVEVQETRRVSGHKNSEAVLSEEKQDYPPVTAEKEEVKAEKEEPVPKTEEKVEETEGKEKDTKVQEKQKVLTEDHDKKDSKPKKSLVSKLKDKITGTKKRKKVQENFLPIIMKFLGELNIDIESHEIVRKNSELNLTIRVPSVVGKLTYYCKAKKKKNCDEKDLSAAYMEAQVKKIPLLFLYSDKINKKAEELLNSGTFDNLIAKKIEIEEAEKEEKVLLK